MTIKMKRISNWYFCVYDRCSGRCARFEENNMEFLIVLIPISTGLIKYKGNNWDIRKILLSDKNKIQLIGHEDSHRILDSIIEYHRNETNK